MDNIQTRFEQFHKDNPHVYDKLVALSREVKVSGLSKYSIDAVFHRLRWHYQFDVTTGERFKLSNDFRSRYARKIMGEELDLRGFFNIKTLKAAA